MPADGTRVLRCPPSADYGEYLPVLLSRGAKWLTQWGIGPYSGAQWCEGEGP
jgi:hypothetical protein